MNLKEEKKNIQTEIDKNVQNIVQAKTDLATAGDEVMNLEQCIYEYSIQNRNLNAEKEKLIELLPEMVKVSQADKPTPEMTAILGTFNEERNKTRVEKILQENKFLPK